MTINDTNYNYGLFNGKPAYRSYFNNTIYVFKDVSSKRIKHRNNFTSLKNRYKIVFVTNKKLLDIQDFCELKDCVFDGKLGTKYYVKGVIGTYHWCVNVKKEKPIPLIRQTRVVQAVTT